MEEQAMIDKELATVHYLFSVERYEDAEKSIQNVLRYNPMHAEALYLMAILQFSRDNYSEARELCREALRYGVNKENAYDFIANTYEKENKLEEAEEAYLAGLREAPLSADLHAEYGRLMMKTGFRDKARALIDKAVELDSTNQRVITIMLDYHLAEDNKGKQIEAIQNLMEYGDDEIKKLVKLAMFHEFNGEEKQAREHAVQAYLMDPTNKNLLAFVQRYDILLHPLFLPRRLIEKLGGGAVVFLGVLVILLLLAALDLGPILEVLFYSSIALVIYNWIAAPLLYNWFVKGKDKWIN